VGGVLARITGRVFRGIDRASFDADEEGRLYAHSRVYLEVFKDNLRKVHNLRHR